MKIASMQQLEKEISRKMKVAVEILTKKIYRTLMDFIDEDIYGSYVPKVYQRTYEFRNKAWDSYVYDFSGEIAGFIVYNPEAMSYNPEKYQHGSEYSDRRQSLAEILNRGEDWSGWDWGRPGRGEDSVYPKPFWDDTLKFLEKNWKKMAKQAFKEAGLQIK